MGLTVIDAGVVIAVLDGTDAHHTAASQALRDARERGDVVVLPASGYAECLVAPSRRGSEAIRTVDEFLDSMPIRIEPVSRPIARAAASLRAEHGLLRLPDALIVATAIELHADRIVTTDVRWPPLRVPVEVVSTDGAPSETTTGKQERSTEVPVAAEPPPSERLHDESGPPRELTAHAWHGIQSTTARKPGWIRSRASR